MDKLLEEYLAKHAIAYDLYQHKPVYTVAESNHLRETLPGLRTKSLFLKDTAGRFYLVCMPGNKRLNISALKKQTNTGKLHFASPEELKQELHVAPGSVSLFCMIHAKNTVLLIDKEVWDAEEAGFHPNINTTTIVLNHINLKRFYDSLAAKREVLTLA
ncbi:hypothetical protein HYZ97_04185 [Candidatus Pacearchaeota archaeon]|nr:hypothetical protein [Candidatus Pacearchaeota archaeon]